MCTTLILRCSDPENDTSQQSSRWAGLHVEQRKADAQEEAKEEARPNCSSLKKELSVSVLSQFARTGVGASPVHRSDKLLGQQSTTGTQKPSRMKALLTCSGYDFKARISKRARC